MLLKSFKDSDSDSAKVTFKSKVLFKDAIIFPNTGPYHIHKNMQRKNFDERKYTFKCFWSGSGIPKLKKPSWKTELRIVTSQNRVKSNCDVTANFS